MCCGDDCVNCVVVGNFGFEIKKHTEMLLPIFFLRFVFIEQTGMNFLFLRGVEYFGAVLGGKGQFTIFNTLIVVEVVVCCLLVLWRWVEEMVPVLANQ